MHAGVAAPGHAAMPLMSTRRTAKEHAGVAAVGHAAMLLRERRRIEGADPKGLRSEMRASI